MIVLNSLKDNDRVFLDVIHRKFLGKMLMDARIRHQTNDIFICEKCKGNWRNALMIFNDKIHFWYDTKDKSTHIIKYNYDPYNETLEAVQ